MYFLTPSHTVMDLPLPAWISESSSALLRRGWGVPGLAGGLLAPLAKGRLDTAHCKWALCISVVLSRAGLRGKDLGTDFRLCLPAAAKKHDASLGGHGLS